MRTSVALIVVLGAALVRSALCDVTDASIPQQFNGCILQRTLLVSHLPGACQEVPAALKMCTARLKIQLLPRNGTGYDGFAFESRKMPAGMKVVSAEYPPGFVTLTSEVQNSVCDEYFEAGTNMNLQPSAKITRTSCPVSSFVEAFMSTYTTTRRVFPQSWWQSSLVPLHLEDGDALPPNTDVIMRLPRFTSSGSYWTILDDECTGRYTVVSGQCMFSGEEGVAPVCPAAGFGAAAGSEDAGTTETVTEKWDEEDGELFGVVQDEEQLDEGELDSEQGSAGATGNGSTSRPTSAGSNVDALQSFSTADSGSQRMAVTPIFVVLALVAALLVC